MTEDRAAQLLQKMLRRKLYVVVSRPLRGFEAMKPLLAAHLDYMIALERKGVLFASGPLAGADGGMSGEGMTILRAQSAEEARALAAGDPFVVNGLRTFELREWTVMEGSVGLQVNFSDQSVVVA